MKVCIACGAKFDSTDWQCPSCHNVPALIKGHLAFSPKSANADVGYKADCFAQIASLEGSNFWFRSRNKLIIWTLKRYFQKMRSFFEIGCGTGFVLKGIEREFPDLILFGSEINISGLAYAEKRLKKTELFQMDALDIPFENEFDVIGIFDVLEHIREDDLVLNQIYQALVPGGGLIVTVPQHPFLWSCADEYACHLRRYEQEDLKQKVEQSGFEIIKTTSFVCLLFPLLIAARSKKKSDPSAELKLGSLTNRILEKTLDAERILIRHNICLPFGGSLLLIARKV